MTDGQLTLMTVIAGALELAGLLMVVVEIWQGRRQAREWMKNAPKEGNRTSYTQLETVGPMIERLYARQGWVPTLGIVLIALGIVLATFVNVVSVNR